MSLLTKTKRREVYLEVAENFHKREWELGLCYALLDAVEMHYRPSEDAEEVFPEFALFKPEDAIRYCLWWETSDGVDMVDVRITCMLLCAEMCNP